MKLIWTISTAAPELHWSERHLRRVLEQEAEIPPVIFKVNPYAEGVPRFVLSNQHMKVLRKIKAQPRSCYQKCSKYADPKRRKEPYGFSAIHKDDKAQQMRWLELSKKS